MYPDQSLYPANSVPAVVRRINNALLRADQVDHHEGRNGIHWMAPIIADAEAGFGGKVNVFKHGKSLISAGVAVTNLGDRLPSQKKGRHVGGKALHPNRIDRSKL